MPRSSHRKKAHRKKKSREKQIKKRHAYRHSPPKDYNPHTMSICNHKNKQRWRGIIDVLVHYTKPATLDYLLQSEYLLLSDERRVESKWSAPNRECEPCAEESSRICALAKGIYFRLIAYDRPFINFDSWSYYGDIALFFSPEVLAEGYYHINTTVNNGFMFPMRGSPDMEEITYTDETISSMTPDIYDEYAPSMELLYRNKVSIQYLQIVFFKWSRDLYYYRRLLHEYNPAIECYLFPKP